MAQTAGTTLRPAGPRIDPSLRSRPAAAARVLAPVGALAAYAAALVAVGHRAGLWGDEGFTARFVTQPWGVLFGDLRHIDINMGLYYVLEKLVTSVTGTGQAGLRALSALSVVLALVATAALARRALGHRTGLAAALLLATNPFTVVLGATARPYALLLLGTAGTALLVLRALERGRRRDWLLWAVAGGLLFSVHLVGVLVVAAEGAFAVRALTAARRPGAGTLRAPLLPVRALGPVLRRLVVVLGPPAAVLALAAVPTVAFLAPADTLDWLPGPTPHLAWDALASALGGAIAPALLALAALGALLRLRTGADRPSPVVDLLVVPALGVAALLPVQSLLVDFYLSPLLVPVTLLAAHAAHGLSRRLGGPAGRAVLAAGVAGGVVLTGHQAAVGTLAAPQDWRAASLALGELVDPRQGDAVAFPNSFYRIVGEYYAGQGVGGEWTAARPVLPAAPWGSLRPYELDRLKRTGALAQPATIVDAASAEWSLWLVGPRDAQFENALAVLTGPASAYRVERTVELRGVTLVHLVR